MSFMEKLLFSNLTNVLEKCISTTDSSSREKYMKKYFEKVFELQSKYKIEHPDCNSSLYPLVRILLSTDEHERAYGIQEKTLRKLLIKSLGIGRTDSKKLEQCNEDEIADTVYEIVKSRNSKVSTLTIKEIDDILNEMAANQKQQFQQTQFEKLFIKGSAYCQKWLVKIILKNMKIKVSAPKILANIHPSAPKLFAKYNHLSTIFEFIESGKAEEALKDVVKPFTPIRSMLSQKFMGDASKILNKYEIFTETKFDGERFQLHMENNEYKYFSRNAHDFSEGFNILITPLIKFKVVVHSIILDGEMVMWNKSDNRVVTKGETDLDVKKMKDVNHHLRPCYCAFDILYLNGTSYLDQPYSRRIDIINSLFDDRVGVMIKSKPNKVRDIEHLVTLINDALEKQEEGIIMKKANSIYMPGEREKGGWWKVKSDYLDGEVVKDFDCVIIGGYFQNNFKRDFIQKYLVGAIEKRQDGKFNVYAIGDVVHGITVQERMKLHDKLMKIAINCKGGKEIEFENGNVFLGDSEMPDVFLPPHLSVVLQIRVSELAPTTDFYTPYTFRFPRIFSIRYDKFWDDSCTMQEFKDVYNSDEATDSKYKGVKKVNKRNVHKDDLTSPSRKAKKMKSRSTAIANFCIDSQEDIEPIDYALEGKEFCVLSTSSNLPSTNELKLLLKLHGASLTEFPRKNKTFAIIAGDLEYKVKIYKNEHNVIKANWLFKHFDNTTVLEDFPELKPRDFHSMTEEMKESFKDSYDEFGDSYFDPIESVEELKEIMNGIKTDDYRKPTTEEIIELEKELFLETNFNFFRGFSAIFVHSQEFPFNIGIRGAEMFYKFRAGESDSNNENALVFVDKKRFKINEHPEYCGRKIIDFKFISDSNDADKLLDIEKYTLNY